MANKISYNKFENYPLVSYNIASYLVENEDLIWKLLKYNDSDAWREDAEHPSLTREEKGSLIYSGQSEETDYRVFLDVGQEIAWKTQACILRVFPYELEPSNYVHGDMIVAFEVFSHYRINHLSNYTTRIDTITQRILHNLNGQDVGGIGRLNFDPVSSNRIRSTLTGNVPYKGRVTLMHNWIG